VERSRSTVHDEPPSRANLLVRVKSAGASVPQRKTLAIPMDAHVADQLTFFNSHAGLTDKLTFKRFIGPPRHSKWVVYGKDAARGAPKLVVRYRFRHTHRVATMPASRSAGRTSALASG
jgi:hypothetical protein